MSGKEKTKETREENPSTARFVIKTRMERKALEFEALDRKKNTFFPWKNNWKVRSC